MVEKGPGDKGEKGKGKGKGERGKKEGNGKIGLSVVSLFPS
jgi:hypothetical protein